MECGSVSDFSNVSEPTASSPQNSLTSDLAASSSQNSLLGSVVTGSSQQWVSNEGSEILFWFRGSASVVGP